MVIRLRRRRPDAAPSTWDRSIALTSITDGRTHVIDEREHASTIASGDGAFRTLCGHTVLPASLTTPFGPRCPSCQQQTRDQQPTAGNVRMAEHSENPAHFEVQARLMQRRNGVVVRDEVRHARTDNLHDAQIAARAFSIDGFTTWIYRVETGSGIRPVYHRVQTPKT